MLTLGHTLLDAAQVEAVREKTEMHVAAARSAGFIEGLYRDRNPEFFKKIPLASDFFRSPAYGDLSRPPANGSLPPRIPFMDKGQLRTLADEHLQSHGPQGFFRAPTSGSTGEPLAMRFDDTYQLSYFARMRFLADEWGLRPEPYSTFEIFVSVFRHLRPRRIVQPALNYALFERVILNPLFWPNLADAVDHIAEKSPQILHGMPSSLERLAELVVDTGRSDQIRPRVIFTAAETLLPGTRDRLESVFQAPVCDTYGLVEVGGIVAEECRDRKGFHINAVDYLVETIGEDGEPVPEGSEGGIVISNLYHLAVPVLRYRTGDFGVLDRSPCSCGRIEPRIVQLAGRALTRFILPDGRQYNPFDVFGEYLLTLPAAQFRMIQDGRFDITLQYRSSESLEEHESMKGIRKAAQAVLLPGARFKVQRVERFEQRGKFQAFLKVEDHEPL